ncbi:DNA methyltransferase [Gulosibacter molinativorax]|uniref:Site-specific DNA-methyltransferase n=1 Tax=Gulosibacter molinativorax TaxID=256821 RepID=A0ABT7CBV0_9MICO|nr:site-specific DNA-methyltransferase [Gulosibacter molinativorax]MDJ1372106.1 site-specific DNA-methyltransferase [Gulosibacter molinativorax]QUY62349.1 DNA modification methylase [Gulosibacter molinativorax]
MHSSPSLLTELPALIAQGRQAAQDAVVKARSSAGTASSVANEVAPNALVHGDNLDALARLYASGERAKLVYLDPPFDSKADYRSRIHTRDDSGADLALEMHTYTDRWAGGTADYLRMLVPRLVLARELLTEDGAICVHLDWHSSHYVRVALDEVFGREHFVNSLVWSYRTGGASRTSAVPRKHDDLLVYRRSDRFRVAPLYERQYLAKSFMGSKVDARGRFYVDTILRDVLEGVITLVDDRGGEKVSDVREVNHDHEVSDDHPGNAASDDAGVHEVSVRPVLNLSAERTGYATQKPEGLLELLLRWMTAPGDLVVDPFGGSGTTAVVAQRLGRRWVSADASARSILVSRARLDGLGATYRLADATVPAVLADRGQVEQPASDNASNQPKASAGLTQRQASAHQLTSDFNWADGMFTLQSIPNASWLVEELGPARGQPQDTAARAAAGSGLGALAGWHVWAGEPTQQTASRIAGAWRNARGNLATTARAELPEHAAAWLELVSLTGARAMLRLDNGPR